MAETYQGWKNHATWAVALWIDNDAGAYQAWNSRAEELVEAKSPAADAKDLAAFELASELKSAFEESKDELLDAGNATHSVWADVLNGVFEDVNWLEIAEHLIDE